MSFLKIFTFILFIKKGLPNVSDVTCTSHVTYIIQQQTKNTDTWTKREKLHKSYIHCQCSFTAMEKHPDSLLANFKREKCSSIQWRGEVVKIKRSMNSLFVWHNAVRNNIYFSITEIPVFPPGSTLHHL